MLEHYYSNSEYIDFNGDIVGNTERGIKFILTYAIEKDRFHAVIEDTDDSNGFHQEIDSVPNDVAKFMIGEEEYNKLKEIHQEESDRNVKKKPVDKLEQAFWNVLKLARGGQQSWWTDKLKEDSDESINTIEQYYNGKYNK